MPTWEWREFAHSVGESGSTRHGDLETAESSIYSHARSGWPRRSTGIRVRV